MVAKVCVILSVHAHVQLLTSFAQRTDEQRRPVKDSRIFSLKAKQAPHAAVRSSPPPVQTPIKGSFARGEDWLLPSDTGSRWRESPINK